ncbi:MAG: tyrosine-type recombinase/integrase [Actinomycetota bacterium]
MPAHLHAVGSLDALWSLVDPWVANMQARGLGSKTIARHEDYVIRFFQRTRTSPDTLTEEQVDAFFRAMKPRCSTRQAYAAGLKSAYKFWLRRRLLEGDNPVAEVIAPSVHYPEPDYFSDDEAREILRCAGNRRNRRRVWAVVLLFETGARIGSLAAVEPADVRGNTIHFRVAKFDKPFSRELTPLGRLAVDQLLELYTPEKQTLVGVAPVTIGNWFRDAAREAGFPEGRVNAHLARNTAITNFYDRTLDPVLSAQFANHGDLRTIHRYIGRKRSMRLPLSTPLTGVDMTWATGQG